MKQFSEQDIPLLKKYFSDRITTAEQDQLKEKLSDPDYQQDLVFYQNFFSTMEDVEDERLKKLMQAEDKKGNSAARVISPSFIRWAVAALLVISAGLFLWRLIDPGLPDYFEPYPVIGSNLSDRGNADDNPLRFYESGEYKKALQFFDEAPSSIANQFYKSIALIGERRPEDAIPLLEQIVTEEESVYARPAQYYLGLAYFHGGDNDRAQTWLNQALATPNLGDRYKSEIEALLSAIRN